MTRYPLPEDFGGKNIPLAEFAKDVERRLQILEHGSRPSTNTDQRGGTYTVRDEAGNVRVQLGAFPDPAGEGEATYGLLVNDAAGQPRMAATDDGLALPPMPGYARSVMGYATVTAASFTAASQGVFPSITTDSFMFTGAVAVDPGTTAEARLVANWGPTSGVLSITAGATAVSWSPTWNWRPDPAPTPGITSAILSLQVRRTAGPGSIYVYDPTNLLHIGGTMINATADGLPA